MNLWIVPASDEPSFQNIPRSLSRPVPVERLKLLGISEPQFAWGARAGLQNDRKFDQMSPEDICVFYTQGGESREKRFWWAGRISSYRRSRDASLAIWGTSDFEHVYFMDEVWETNLSLEKYGSDTGYDAAAPKGIFRASDKAIARLAALKLTPEQWARSHSTSLANTIPLLAEDNAEESPMKQILDIVKSSGFHFSDSAIRNFYASIRAKPFVILAGNSGTGKSRLVRLFAEACGATAANGGFHLVAVRPDWSDGGELLGYLDLQNTFRPGQLLEPLLRAHALPQQPVFVCLDEMNLARVEHYFSDFLSKIESRRRAADRSVVSDAVISARDLELLAPASIPESLRNTLARLKSAQQGVCLPPNLIVVGTVNMDETTHAFSRKVLDRANTLEIDAGQLGADLPSPTPVVPPTPSLGAIDLTAPFLTAQDMVQDPKHTEALAHVAGLLDSLNDILSEANLQVAYRTRDEAAAFFIHATAVGLSSDEADHAIVMQKILPRVQGSSPRLARILRELLNRFQPGGLIDSNSEKLKEELLVLRKDTSRSPLVRKIASMWLIYEEEGFTSFWVA